jgi:hypothetical protein
MDEITYLLQQFLHVTTGEVLSFSVDGHSCIEYSGYIDSNCYKIITDAIGDMDTDRITILRNNLKTIGDVDYDVPADYYFSLEMIIKH